MELKEVVNLRRLGEWYEEVDDLCQCCPFRKICGRNEKYSGCMVDKMLFGDEPMKDLYDMEEDGTLTKDYML